MDLYSTLLWEEHIEHLPKVITIRGKIDTAN